MREEKPVKAFSAPGKALLAGGYLVLFPEYSAYSVALSSRMHAVVFNSASESNKLTISSPQFLSRWEYLDGKQVFGTHGNPFVDACVAVIGSYYGQNVGGKVEIFSDSGFHSQTEVVASNSRFSNHNKPITEVPKTGLGSSAALCTVVSAALMYLNGDDATEGSNLEILHRLAQISHCVAQRKVGSGFDVASAVYGSIIYSRFSPEAIPKEITHESVTESIANDGIWRKTMRIDSCSLPKSLALLLGDVRGGSETPGMVRKMLEWRQTHPDKCHNLWTALNAANLKFVNGLQSSNVEFSSIRHDIQAIRSLIQELSLESGVPVEPQEQTKLLETVKQIPGVVNGVVPGAGGHDAVCLLADSARSDEILSHLNGLSSTLGAVWTHMTPEKIGLKSENILDY